MEENCLANSLRRHVQIKRQGKSQGFNNLFQLFNSYNLWLIRFMVDVASFWTIQLTDIKLIQDIFQFSDKYICTKSYVFQFSWYFLQYNQELINQFILISGQPTVVFPLQNNKNRTLLEHSNTLYGYVFAKFNPFPHMEL